VSRFGYILLAVFFLFAGNAHAESRMKVACTRILRKFVFPLIIPDPRNQTLMLTDISDPSHPIPVEVKVGARLGIGMKGAVYRLDDIKNHPSIPDYAHRETPLVGKVSHQGRRTGVFFKLFQDVLVEEHNVYEGLVNSQPAIEADPEFDSLFTQTDKTGNITQRGPSWDPGTLPVAKIYATGSTPWGIALVKDEIDPKKALGLTDVAKRAKENMEKRLGLSTEAKPAAGPWKRFLKKLVPSKRPEIELEDIPLDMQQSMREWYRLSQIASKHTRFKLVNGQERALVDLDINPDNLMWVEDPEQQKLFHLKRAGFVAPELGEPALTHYVRENLVQGRNLKNNSASEEAYLAAWVTYLRQAAKGLQ